MGECPAHVPSDRVVSFDPYRDPARFVDPFEAFDQLRGRPLSWSGRYGGFWIATDAPTVREVYQDPELFSSSQTGIPVGNFWPRPLLPIELDPPEHRKYRSLLVAPLSPTAVGELEVPVRRTCERIVAELAPRGGCDFVTDFAQTFPTTIFVDELFGFPSEMADDFVRWNFALLHGKTVEERKEKGDLLVEFLQTCIEARSATRDGDDLISVLLRAEVDGRPVTEEEVLDTAFLLFLAGLDTVATALNFSFHYLATHPDHRRALAADRALIPGAMEELLRYHAFVSNTRTVTRDAEFHGIQLRRGDRMHLPAPVGGRDPEEFERADDVDFERRPNRHMTFGAGPHRCVGMHLARLELRVALEVWHDRIPEYELSPEEAPLFRPGTILSVERLALRWQP